MTDYEKLGVFYLGRRYDLAKRQPTQEPVLYDSKDLVTHAVCVGMTGSGKTGLCIGLLEEAAIDGIPAIVIDPKGDLTNLLLTFPDLRGADLLPFVEQRAGADPAAFAEQQAALWREGLAEWRQTPDRIRKLKESAEFAIYTPASRAGRPVSVLRSFAAPPAAALEDRETMRELVSGTAASLLALAGIGAGPQSREHVLLSTILDRAWRAGRHLTLAAIIEQVRNPPVSQVGIMDVESFYPAKERFQLAMAFNTLLASPGFEAWMEGEPLDPGALLHTPQGKPRVAIFSIAHLSDGERMFFTALLLNQVVSWMRTQPGTTSLRALVYMDEIFGYFPPTAAPPSKQPLLTLMKQARAFGIGVVLATQNPVDIDYKGLSNAGTWFIGRLQTERDKARLLDGLESAAGSMSRPQIESALSQLGSRVFLMHNVHEDAAVVFQTRWTLSYLRGPLTREQIRMLTPAADEAVPRTVQAASPARPVLPPGIPQQFAPASAGAVYKPMLYGAATVRFTDARKNVDVTEEVAFLTPITAEAVAVDWPASQPSGLAPADLEPEPPPDVSFVELPPTAAVARNYTAWSKAFAAWLYQTRRLVILKSPSTGLVSNPGESERDFRVRAQQAAREERDAAAQRLRAKYAPRIAAMEERVRRARQAVERERGQAAQQKMGTMVSVGATLLGAFLGRKTLSAANIGRATAAVRNYGRIAKEAQDVTRAGETVEALENQLRDLNAQFEGEVREAEARLHSSPEPFDRVEIAPRKANIEVKLVSLLWTP